MRILHVCNHFHPCIGGIEKYVYDLCKNLQKMGHKSDVCCLNKCGYSGTALPEHERYDGIDVFRVPFLAFKWYNIAPTIYNFFKGYDIIHVHSIGFLSDFTIVTKHFHRKPIILNTHGGIFHTRYVKAVKDIYFNFWCRLIFKNVYKILADGDSDKRRFDEISPNVDIVPITVETKKYASLKRKPEKGRFLYVGRLSKNKRLDNLIKTFAVVNKKDPKARLYIVGPAWESMERELKGLTKKLGVSNSIVFTGRVSDEELLDQIKKAQLFLFASEYEGRPVTLMEIMASGLPMIVNDIEIFRDFVSEGKNGFLTDFTKYEESANKILSVMRKDLKKISRASKESSKKYDWSVAIKRIEKLYKDALMGS